MTKLYEYLISNYKSNEPIFVSDLQISISDANLQQMFNLLCDSGKIKRFDTGIYYLPKESRLTGGVPLGADTVARYKYVSRNGRMMVIILVIRSQISLELLHRCRIH